ncbi:MAG: hypothetical protein FWC79_04185 [Oscillospiraceae bacterium]|nr:hypothetical protein [Oscillospiraceae bacterium]
MRNPVRINMKRDEIIIMISEQATYAQAIESLEKKIPALKKLYKAEKTPICVMGKVLKNKEMNEISRLIKNEIDVEVSFDSPQILGLHGIKKVFERDIENSETKFYRSGLRSGQRLEFEGSLVILGDVNGGAEVIAGENIVILGELRGLAHAGAKGNKKAIIAANCLDCPQIRIANVIKEMEEADLYEEYKYAYIQDEKMVLES